LKLRTVRRATRMVSPTAFVLGRAAAAERDHQPSRFRALGAPIVSRGARQLPLITRGIGRRRETRHSVAPRIHALSVHRVVRQPVLRSGVLPADLLHNGRVVVWLLRLLRECGNCDGHGYGRCDD
jgi:hypothetical protein